MAIDSIPNPTDLYVGERLRLRRKQLKMSQSVLGEALGLTFQQIQKYERGANRISASMLLKAARAVDVEISYFFAGIPDLPSGSGDILSDARAVAAAIAVPAVCDIPSLSRDQQIALQTLLCALTAKTKEMQPG